MVNMDATNAAKMKSPNSSYPSPHPTKCETASAGQCQSGVGKSKWTHYQNSQKTLPIYRSCACPFSSAYGLNRALILAHLCRPNPTKQISVTTLTFPPSP